MQRPAFVLLLLLAACDFDGMLPDQKAKDAPILQDTKVFRAQLEIQRLEAEVLQYQTMRHEWPADWRAIKRSGRDPWDQEYVLEIVGDKAVVYSSGPDKELGTDDDVYGQ